MPRAVVVGPRGQITLPKSLRQRYGFRPGEAIILQDREDGVFLQRKRSVLRGILRGSVDGDEFERALMKLRNRWKIRHASGSSP